MKGQPLGLDELMIVNPSHQGGGHMFNQYIHGSNLGYYGPYADDGYAGQGRYPEAENGAWGAHAHDGMGYSGQYPQAQMGAYDPYPQDGMGDDDGGYASMGMSAYGQDPEEEIMAEDLGVYGDDPEDELGFDGPYPEHDLGAYDPYAESEMGDYGPYAEAHMGYPDIDPGVYGPYAHGSLGGYEREVEPPFNPRGDFGHQLAGYERVRSVNPTCGFEQQADVTPAVPAPDIFKPYF